MLNRIWSGRYFKDFLGTITSLYFTTKFYEKNENNHRNKELTKPQQLHAYIENFKT